MVPGAVHDEVCSRRVSAQVRLLRSHACAWLTTSGVAWQHDPARVRRAVGPGAAGRPDRVASSAQGCLPLHVRLEAGPAAAACPPHRRRRRHTADAVQVKPSEDLAGVRERPVPTASRVNCHPCCLMQRALCASKLAERDAEAAARLGVTAASAASCQLPFSAALGAAPALPARLPPPLPFPLPRPLPPPLPPPRAPSSAAGARGQSRAIWPGSPHT